LKAHFANINAPPDAIMLLGARGHYVGVARVTEDRWNVALSVPQERLRACDGDGDRLLEIMMAESSALAAALNGSRRVTEWLAAPLPRFGVAKRWPRRVIPIGNAAAALEPIGGEGMGLAMRSAELATEALLEAERKRVEVNVAQLRRNYVNLWNARRLACRVSALAVSNPALAHAVLPLAESGPLARLAMSWMGK
jgi:flavin-dependent dehydrogenase